MTLETKRLLLRAWKMDDLEPFSQLNQDPKVMEYFLSTLTKEETEALIKRFELHIAEKGYGLWAVSLKNSSEFIGFIGLQTVSFHEHFTPAVEIGWRLASSHWGKGYATEGAKAALQYGFERANLDEIVSFTARQNIRSQNVMKKIGMHHTYEDDFDHPMVPKEHPLRKHVLYRLLKHEWISQSTLPRRKGEYREIGDL